MKETLNLIQLVYFRSKSRTELTGMQQRTYDLVGKIVQRVQKEEYKRRMNSIDCKMTSSVSKRKASTYGVYVVI